jgi:CRP-like cAMP-binding protein
MESTNLSQLLREAPIKKVKKGELLLRNGDSSDSFYHVVKGCLRSYTIDTKGKEHVIQFAPEDWIITDQESFITQNALSILNIDALEDSEIKVLKRPPSEELIRLDHDTLAEMNLKLLRRTYVLQKRIISLLSATAEERYLDFIKLYPGLVQRIPQKMIASYLGVTPEGLSRVRKEIVKKSKLVVS